MAPDGSASGEVCAMMRAADCRRIWPWALLGLIAVAVLVTRLHLSFDISAFFPHQLELQHNVLLQQFRSGPASRLVVIGIKGGNEDALAVASDQMRQALFERAVFTTVMNGEPSEDGDDVPEPVASYYLLMEDIDFSADALQQAVRERVRDLAFGGGVQLLGLVARDPYLATLDILQRLAPVELAGEMWFAEDGSAVLMAQTSASAVDIEAQSLVVAAVREEFVKLDALGDFQLEITGAGPFGVELQKTIRAEAQKRTILAMTALFIVLFIFYRRPRLLLLATVPIGMGFLVGLAVVSLLFNSVHGITLAFGFTLMGVAIDYPLHLFSHATHRGEEQAIQRIWPTMRLGAVSTIIAYLALAFSGSEGLAQLGTFTAAGIAVAALATRSLVPSLMATTKGGAWQYDDSMTVPARHLLALVALTLACAWVFGEDLWDDRLSSLSPVSEDRLRTDNLLRAAAGTPDMRYQLVIHGPSLDSVLERGEEIDALLASVPKERLAGWQSVTQVLPSAAVEKQRRGRLPKAEQLRIDLAGALFDTPFRAGAFEAFVNSVEVTLRLPPLAAETFANSPLRPWLDTHLFRVGDEWVSLVSLRGADVEYLANRVAQWGGEVFLMDAYESSVRLMQDYRSNAIGTVLAAALLILGLLWYERRDQSQILWIGLSVCAGLATTIAVVQGVQGPLTVIHLVALLLVGGLGLDYALFLSRTESAAERRASRRAVLACVATTSVTFGILAASSIPVLKYVGFTVTVGVVANYLITLAGTLHGR